MISPIRKFVCLYIKNEYQKRFLFSRLQSDRRRRRNWLLSLLSQLEVRLPDPKMVASCTAKSKNSWWKEKECILKSPTRNRAALVGLRSNPASLPSGSHVGHGFLHALEVPEEFPLSQFWTRAGVTRIPSRSFRLENEHAKNAL